MATSAQQATFAAQKGKNWAAPGEAGFGTAGYIGQPEYDEYATANPGETRSTGTLVGDTVGNSVDNTGPKTTGQALTQQATVGATPTQGGQSTVAGAFQQALLNNLAPAPVTASDPTIAPAIQANQLAQQRAQERQRGQLAEQAAATGTNNSGGFGGMLLGLDQARAQQEGQFNADAIQGQTDKNRQAQLTMAALAGGLLQGTDAQTLQKYGIDTSAATQNKGIDTQAALGQGDLALRDKLGSGQLNLGLLSALLQNNQFGEGLSANNAQFGANLNQQAILKAMGY